MRKGLFIIIALSIGSVGKAQPYVGMGAGYSSAKSPVINLQIGVKFNDNLVFYNQLIHISRKSHAPQILGLRYGYSIGSFQANAGFDYHLFSSDKYNKDKPGEGVHLAFGLTKYFKKIPVKIDLGVTNRYVISSIGIYKLLY